MGLTDIKVEELGGGKSCEENAAGIVTVLYAPLSHFVSLAEPKGLCDDVTKYADYVTIKDDHVFKDGYGWTRLKIMQEGTSFEGNGIGGVGARAEENKLPIKITGTKAEIAGWVRRFKNEDLVFLFQQHGDSAFRQIGSRKFAAKITEKKAVIGETVEGDAYRVITVSDKQMYEAPFYEGVRTMQVVAPVTPEAG